MATVDVEHPWTSITPVVDQITTLAIRELNMEAATIPEITDNQGYPSHTAWATMRGVAWTRPIMPGDATAVECRHCQVLWRNRYFSPWAQSRGIISNAGTSSNANGRDWSEATGRPYAVRLFD